jgi:hypothetical protein
MQPDKSSPLLKGAIELILQRGTGLSSVWKRKGDLTTKERMEVNAFAAVASDEVEAFEATTRILREKHNLLIAIHKFGPYSKRAGTEDSVLTVRTRNGLRPASAMSPLLRSLDEAWQEDIHMHVFALEANEMSPGETIRLMKEVLAATRKKAATRKQAVTGKKAATRTKATTRNKVVYSTHAKPRLES